MNNIIFHLVDVKLSIAGIIFCALTFSDVEVGLKIVASLLMIGYTIRRWRHFENNKTTKVTDEE